MSDTPRTDAEIGRVHISEGRNMVTADFARQLERELSTERETMLHWQKCATGEGFPTERHCDNCGTSWTAPVSWCPACGFPEARRPEEVIPKWRGRNEPPLSSGWYMVWTTKMPDRLRLREIPSCFYNTSSGDWDWMSAGEVTHWAELPQAPVSPPRLTEEPK